MKQLITAVAAIALVAGLALSAPAMAQAPLDCNSNNHSGPVQGSTGAGQNAPPAGSTCETLVQPNGQTMIQNGPAVSNPGSNTAPHDGGNGSAGGGGSKG
jgi:hypothetical protein